MFGIDDGCGEGPVYSTVFEIQYDPKDTGCNTLVLSVHYLSTLRYVGILAGSAPSLSRNADSVLASGVHDFKRVDRVFFPPFRSSPRLSIYSSGYDLLFSTRPF